MYNLQGKPLYVCGSNKSPRPPPPPPPPIPMDPSIDLHSPRLTRISRWNRCDRCQTIIDYPRFDCSQPAIPSVLLPSTKIPLSPPTNIDETLENVFARFLYCCTRINTFQNNKKDSGRSRILYARHNSKKKKKKSPLQVSQITVISSGNYPMMSSSVGSRSNALRIATRTNFYSPNSYFYDNPSNERNKKGKCFAKFKNFRIEKASSPIKITCRRSFSSREFWTSLYIYNGGREGGYAKYLKQLKFASWKAELNEATSTIRPEHAILRKPTVLSAEWKTMAILIGDSRASVRTYTHTDMYAHMRAWIRRVSGSECESERGWERAHAPSRFTPTPFGNLSGYEITSYLISRSSIFREEHP